jgi:hypothetical protein
MNDMDAFKELMARSPDLDLMNIEQTQALVFWSGAAAKWARLQVDHGKHIQGMQAQCAAWVREGQIAGELELRGQQRLGKLAKETEKAAEWKDQPRDAPRADKPKWQRLGFKSAAAMEQAEFLEAHPVEVTEVIQEAKKEDDFISKGAVKAKVRVKRLETQAAKYAERNAERERERKEAEEKGLPGKYPKEVKAYLDASKAFKEELELAIRCKAQDMFSPEAVQFIKNRHETIRELMKQLEK